MTPEQVDAIEAKCDWARPGPWEMVLSASGEPLVFAYRHGEDTPNRRIAHSDNRRDAEFIAAARADVPALIAALRESWAEVERLKGFLSDVDRKQYESDVLADWRAQQ